MANKIIGVKGFDKDLKCRDFQFEIGKTYKEENAKCCESGFHFCENPLETFSYYETHQSRYCIVEGSGKIDNDHKDSKVSCTKIKIVREINFYELTELSKEY